MIVARIRTMNNRTDNTTMREEANEYSVVLDPVLAINIVLSSAVFIHVVVGNFVLASNVVGGDVGWIQDAIRWTGRTSPIEGHFSKVHPGGGWDKLES